MIEKRIAELDVEIESYRQAIEDAQGALDAAEKELNEVLCELGAGEERRVEDEQEGM